MNNACQQPHAPIAMQPLLQRALHATRIQFLALGTVFGLWGAHIPSLASRYALGDARLSLVLLAVALGSVSTLFIAGRVLGRFGARRASAGALLLICAALGSALEHAGLVTLLPAMLLFGAGMSIFDVAINSAGSELESLGGRPVMSNLHGMFSVGGMLGAGLAATLLGAGVAASVQLACACALIACAGLLAARSMLAAPESAHDAHDVHDAGDAAGAGSAANAAAAERGAGPDAHFAWPRGRLLVIGLLIFAGMSAEGVMYDWSVLYLKQDLALPQAAAALGYASFAGAMALARFGGDALRLRWPDARLLRSGACIAAATMLLVLLMGNGVFALIGFAVVGAALAPVAPILFNAATQVPGVSRAAAIASVTSVGYSGFLIGPPLIGGIASVSSLGVALGVVVLASLALAAGASRVPQPRG